MWFALSEKVMIYYLRNLQIYHETNPSSRSLSEYINI